MRMIFVLTVVVSAAIGLVSSDGAEPAPPPSLPHAVPSPAVAPSPATGWAYGAPENSHDHVASLRREYVAMATKHADRMDGPQLQQGIAEMRRQWLIAELTDLAGQSDDVRAGVAAMALKAKDQTELKKLLRSIVEEMDAEKPTAK